MNSFSISMLLSTFIITLLVLGSDSSPQRNFRTNTNRRSARQQEFDGTENELTTIAPPGVYSPGNNNPGYGGGFGNGNGGFPTGMAFLPPPLMMMMMMRNAAMGGGLMGPDGGIDMVTVQRILQAVAKVLQEVEQEKRGNGAGASNSAGAAAAMRMRG